MYEKSYNKDGSLKHSNECTMQFGRKDPECARCAEMIAGAPSRSGWQKSYFTKKQQEENLVRTQVREHDCKKSGCGYVCTAFEW